MLNACVRQRRTGCMRWTMPCNKRGSLKDCHHEYLWCRKRDLSCVGNVSRPIVMLAYCQALLIALLLIWYGIFNSNQWCGIFNLKTVGGEFIDFFSFDKNGTSQFSGCMFPQRRIRKVITISFKNSSESYEFSSWKLTDCIETGNLLHYGVSMPVILHDLISF